MELYGATHYSTVKDGVTPQMYYKQETIHINDGTTKRVWLYLSYANIWMRSSIEDGSHLVAIADEKKAII